MHIWPRSLATRTAVVLVACLVVAQVAGLTIHAFDRLDVVRLAQARDVAVRAMALYRAVLITPPLDRAAFIAAQVPAKSAEAAHLDTGPPATLLTPAPLPLQQSLRLNMGLFPLPGAQRPKQIVIDGGPVMGRVSIGLRLPDATWLDVTFPYPPPRPWHSQTFLLAFVLMTVVTAAISVWAVRRMIKPVETLAAAADRLGRDVGAPPLPEDGPAELALAAAAFNTMAGRIRRFVQDRTFVLAAIGHDLRTPITRLKLRAEFVEDEELRRKFLADLDELEQMVAATLTFARDAVADEPVASVDLAELARTVLDEAGDARADPDAVTSYTGPDHLPVRARPLSLKRALMNLVTNALKYGNAARVVLSPPADGMLRLAVEDDGPGIPVEELERVFQPFHRLEPSRNRETGGMGLGLPIARNILRAHGGDVTLSNRPSGGVRAMVVLPA